METKREHTYKKVAMGLFFLALFLPMFQTATGLFRVRMLHGDYTLPDAPVFHMQDWLEGNFVPRFEKYVETRVGFRKFFIRLRNQVRYSALYQSNKQVVLGKNNYLYEAPYIQAYWGNDRLPLAKIIEQTQKLKKVQQRLAADSIKLLVLMAPGKASFFPDYFPFELSRGQVKKPGNFELYQNCFDHYQVPYIDFRKWFLEMKGQSEHLLFNRMGIHWTTYGSLLAGDSLIRYLENAGQRSIGRMEWTDIERTNNPRPPDHDIMEIMNLMSPLDCDTLSYPKVTFKAAEQGPKPNVLTVGDSYFWNIMMDSIPFHFFADSSAYWFYNEKIFGINNQVQGMASERNLREELKGRDFIIISVTEPNLVRFPFGFIDQVYDLYFGTGSQKD